jgi:hypothetical protein
MCDGWLGDRYDDALDVFEKRYEHIDQRTIGARDYRESARSWLDTDRSLLSRWPTLVRVRVPGVFIVAAIPTADAASFIVASIWHNWGGEFVAVLMLTACGPRTVRSLESDGWNDHRATSVIMVASANAAPVASGLGYAVSAADIGLEFDLILELLPIGPARRLIPRAVMLGPVAGRG